MGINRRFVDLHIHSTASDGTTPPEKLIEVARAETALALSEGWISEEPQEYIMALTDHDTLAGIPALEKAARLFENVRIIPGVEISSDYQGHEIHILATMWIRRTATCSRDWNITEASGSAGTGEFWENSETWEFQSRKRN